MRALVIGGESFSVRDELDEWSLMKLAKSQTSDNSMARLAGMHDFVLALLDPAERSRFEAFMASGQEPGALDRAIGALLEDYTGRPTERPSSSPDGSPTTEASSRVVSLSPGTARGDQVSPKAGQSAAS